jgi:hypothetical protein
MLTNDMSPGPSSDEIQSGSRGVRGAEVPARSVSRYRGAPTRVTRPPAARYREPPRVVSAFRARGLRGPPRPGARSTCRALPRAAAGCVGVPSAGASRTASQRRPAHLLRATAGRRGCVGVPSAGASRTAASRRPVHLSRTLEGRHGCAGEPRAPGGLGGPSRPPISMARHGSVGPIRGLSRIASSRRPSQPPRALEGRHGCAGEPRALGGLGGPFRGPPFQTDARCE